MFGIQVEESGPRIEVGMWGEFDAFSLPTLREVLDEVCAFGGPTVVDLSGITFLDLQSTRELVVRSLIQTHQLIFQNPSPNVVASIKALGMRHEPQLHTSPGNGGHAAFEVL